MATVTTTRQQPSLRQRRMARERALLERTAALYKRRIRPEGSDGSSDEYRWYRRFLLDEHPAPGFGC